MEKKLQKISMNVNGFFEYMPNALIGTDVKKTIPSISKAINVTQKSVYEDIKDNSVKIEGTGIVNMDAIRAVIAYGEVDIVIDDTRINKPHANAIEGVADGYDSASKSVIKGIGLICLNAVSDDFNIPLIFSECFSKNISPELYETKTVIASRAIAALRELGVKIRFVIGDSHYSVQTFIDFLNKNDVDFLMKTTKSKVMIIRGVKSRLEDHPALRFIKNERSIVASADWKGRKMYAIHLKIYNENNEIKDFYLVSSTYLKPKAFLKLYKSRWKIECMFRTLKQYLGIKNYSGKSNKKQLLWIIASIFAYTKAEFIRINTGCRNVESILKYFRETKEKIPLWCHIPTAEVFHAIC